ncbi:uncharacterized protein At4g38062-like [Quercus robur]|uniref:uncharacterized protein At4g38062-like n=1 Tax=Quercus robur TaxID=38942 RepID=UPI002161CD37|nr:uncharacterized protein At4g38062-like [Quercus robur]XP_050261491.1 uncharacterized protein At4g38062-like [Quercus robur]XP_050261492.1 uncharacterized protein At4g38062-like [Quercus robur]XP_050261493.1 uncharacterized protein At4g38062-like [Quercus robur]
MEDVYKELDEVKAEIEKLKAEYRIKTELSESLKRAHNEQLLKHQEAKLQIEKQTQELNAKSEEISELRKINEDLTSSLHEKELSFRHLSSVNEKFRADCGQKLQKLEGENRELVLALDETTARKKELELNVCDSHKEIEGLKRLLLVTERKCFEAEQMAQKPKELRQRDVVIVKLEEENRDVQDQLKWKNEQFKHLEEAHKRLQDQFQLSKEEWEREKSALLEEISSLQTNLDSQTRILEGLQTRLDMCNQALAHEESRRKFLEVQVSEFKIRFENVFAQSEEETSKVLNLTVQRDEEIARLRNALGSKETLTKEMEFKIAHLEQENQDLGESLKELREAQIKNAGATSLTKLRNKLKGLEQVHSNCSNNLKAKESEWSFQMEKMKSDIDSYKSGLKDKVKQIKELQMDLENSHSTIEVLSEEISIVCTILKSEISEAYSKILDAKAEMELHDKEKEGKISHLIEQLKVNKSHLDLGQENKELASLRKRVESLECMQASKDDELQRYKQMLEESSECQLQLKKQVLQMESALENEKRGAFEALEKANLELAEKICEASQLQYEVQKWKSDSESLKACLNKKQETCKQLETSLITQAKLEQMLKDEKENLLYIAKEQEKRIEGQQQQIVSLEAKIVAKTEELEASLKDKDSILLIAEEKEICIENLQKDLIFLKQESKRREAEASVLGRLAAEKAFEEEKEKFLQLMNEKDQGINDLQVLAVSLEQDLEIAVISCFSELIEKHVKFIVLNEAIKNAEYLTKLEIEEKNKLIVNLQKDLIFLKQESKRREAEASVLGRVAVEKAFEEEKERFLQIMNEKDQGINDLRVLAVSLEQDLEIAVISCFPELIENHVKIIVLNEAIKNAEYLTKLEIEEKNKLIANLEKEACNLRQRLAYEEECLLCSRREEEQYKALLEVNKLETEKLKDEQRSMDCLVKELEFEKGTLVQDSLKLSTEREDLLVHIQKICNQIGEFSFEDEKLMTNLGRILQNSVEETGRAMDLMVDGELYDSTRENSDTCFSGTTKKLEAGGDERLPLKEVNH